MTFDLTPTELNRLHTEGSVRVVRKAPEPTGFYKGVPVFAQPMDKPHMQVTPFPPAGTREVIDGVDCVWDHPECKQSKDIHPDCPLWSSGPQRLDWFFTATIRKDTE